MPASPSLPATWPNYRRASARKSADGSKVDHANHPAALVLNNPNSYQTRVDFWGQFMASALFTGNAYVFLVRDAANVIRSMHILDPRQVRVLLSDDGSVFYQIGQERLAELLATDVIPARDILHHRLLTLNHPLVGLTPLYAAGVSAMTGQTIQQNSYAFFANMTRASGVLTGPGKISQELANRLKTEWDQNFKGGQHGPHRRARRGHEVGTADHQRSRRAADRAAALVRRRCGALFPRADLHADGRQQSFV